MATHNSPDSGNTESFEDVHTDMLAHENTASIEFEQQDIPDGAGSSVTFDSQLLTSSSQPLGSTYGPVGSTRGRARSQDITRDDTLSMQQSLSQQAEMLKKILETQQGESRKKWECRFVSGRKDHLAQSRRFGDISSLETCDTSRFEFEKRVFRERNTHTKHKLCCK